MFSYSLCVSRDGANMAVTIWLDGRPISSDSFHQSEGVEAVHDWIDSTMFFAMLGVRIVT
jgi:hypothetical protein